MFLEDVFFENAKSDLSAIVARHAVEAPDCAYRWDTYLAKSHLQKAVRRGDVRNALISAQFLLLDGEQTLWRRLCIIALEDIGIANVPLVAQVHIAAKERALRTRLGGSAKVALAVVAEMCGSAKDRSTDDLIDALGSPDFDCLKAELAELSRNDLFRSVASPSLSIHHRAIAAFHLAAPTTPTNRAKGWSRLLEQLPEDLLSPCIKATAQIGLQRTKSEMALYLALLGRDRPLDRETVDEDFPSSVDLAGLPSWVLDGHTRLGLSAFRLYLKRSTQIGDFIARWATGTVSPAKTVAGLVFRIESAQLANRLNWPTGDLLKQQACRNRPGLPSGAGPEGMAIVAEEFDLVNDCRAEAVRSFLQLTSATDQLHLDLGKAEGAK